MDKTWLIVRGPVNGQVSQHIGLARHNVCVEGCIVIEAKDQGLKGLVLQILSV